MLFSVVVRLFVFAVNVVSLVFSVGSDGIFSASSCVWEVLGLRASSRHDFSYESSSLPKALFSWQRKHRLPSSSHLVHLFGNLVQDDSGSWSYKSISTSSFISPKVSACKESMITLWFRLRKKDTNSQTLIAVITAP